MASPSAALDPIAPMRFLPLYRLGLSRCTYCCGPMSHCDMLESGHGDCFTAAWAKATAALRPWIAATSTALSDLCISIGQIREPMRAVAKAVPKT